MVYNAKAHPHLSNGDMLLISYNVNVEGEGVMQWTIDYHPRFLWLDLDPTTPSGVSYDSDKGSDNKSINIGRNLAVTGAFIITFCVIYIGVCLSKTKTSTER